MPPTCTAIGQLSEVASTGTTRLYSDYGYDSATGLLISAQCTTNTGTTHASIADRAYSRDNAGNITEAATTSATTATDTQCYAYDHLSELTAAWTPSTGDCTAAPSASALGGPAPYLDQYTYDTGTGNRLSASTVNGAVSTQQVYAYPAAGVARPHAVSTVTSTGSSNGTSSYGYDGAGDTTTRPGQSLTYDPSGRLATVKAGSSTQSEVYDASGTLLLRTDPTGSTLFLGETELHQASGSANVSAVRTYTLAGKAVAERTTQPGVTGNGTLAWLGTDVDGTADVEVDSVTGHVTRRYSDPFGNSRGTIPAWSSDHGFLNKTVDTSTGLTQLGARVYDATIGKFLSVDPILAPDNPEQDNGYAYAGNNPITDADPSGACYVGSSDSLNFHTTCYTAPTKKNPRPRVTYNNVAAAGMDTGQIQDFRSGVSIPTRQNVFSVCAKISCSTSSTGSPEGTSPSRSNPGAYAADLAYKDSLIPMTTDDPATATDMNELLISLCMADEGTTCGLDDLGWALFDARAAAGALGASSDVDWAQISGMLRQASEGKGNFGLGSGTSQEADAAGQAWVGDGAKLASNGKTLVSNDGLRQYRPPSYKPRLGSWQANLESRDVPNGEWQNNGHFDVNDAQ